MAAIDYAKHDGLGLAKLVHHKEVKPIELVDALSKTGLKQIQVCSFVPAKNVPGMADAEEVANGFTREPGVRYEALSLNEKGLERAVNGAFAKAFKSGLQPVEITAALRRELDDGATLESACAVVDDFVRTHGRTIRGFWYFGYANPQFDVERACISTP